MANSNGKAVAAVAAIVVAGAVVALLMSKSGVREPDAVVAPAPSTPAPVAGKAADAAPQEIVVPLRDVPVEELKYLPAGATIPDGDLPPGAAMKEFRKGNRRLTGIRQIVKADDKGGFLAPQISPDGLQIMLTRAGYQGIYVVSSRGGDPQLVAEVNAWGAKWTADGRIEVKGADGNIQVYATDGTLEEVRPAMAEPIYAENDTVFVRGADGAAPVALTGSEDRFYGPQLSPDGTKILVQGLYTGLYLMNADGSGEPVYLGPGTSPRWAPDGSGVVYEVTADDGHSVSSGDLYFGDTAGSERTNMTEDFDGIGLKPSVGPNGKTVAFESDGGVFVGEMQ